MKILIVDNEAEIRALLADMINSIFANNYLIEQADGVESGIQKIIAHKPDIVFLDIEMNDGSGFDLIKQINNPTFQLIFTTAHNKYAVQAFKCSAIDYLLKPIDFNELENALKKANENISASVLVKQLDVLMQQLTQKENIDKQIVLKDSETSYFVKVNEILFCEAEGAYTKFYLLNGLQILISKNLSIYDEILSPLGFIRTHHSFLVNAAKIKRFDKADGGKLILETGNIVPVSHRKKDYVIHQLENK